MLLLLMLRNQTIKAIEQIKPKVRCKRAALDSIEENNKNQLDAIPKYVGYYSR